LEVLNTTFRLILPIFAQISLSVAVEKVKKEGKKFVMPLREIGKLQIKKCHAIAWHMGDTRFIVR
jgi:uncharacterized protein YfaP (DUF2135 family)